ncbi:uncharacterized protein K452DRAFT_306731 [Aplosporella prunicola CBS 121167]|uniref:Uncharacterized protein n=1 Tax=Aplosporella prunicola CBS 121167 TaxID=1176127 RepID=A0A6A6BL45_9PEZI|nr:uncharacterized protein K452DRAFT_306731 [Aplosporella prunicola CBS 121167]KAF2144103.1 hypothetical protein K452DRAFT_306731 [Aplosporella prunicola CBS 121167]
MLPLHAMHHPSAIPVRDTVASASPIPLSSAASRQGSSRIVSPLTPPDNGVLAIHEAKTGSSADEWRQLLARARGNFENERKVWEQERQLYQRDIVRLQQALEAKEREFLVMATKLKQAELAVADPASFHTGIVSPTAEQKGSSPVKSPPTGFLPHHTNMQSPPIPGVPHPMTSFTVTHHGGDGSNEVDVSGDSLYGRMNCEEGPSSPVSTAANLSPPPPSYRRHAGHTPGKMGSFSIEHTPGEKTPRAPQPVAPEPVPQQPPVEIIEDAADYADDDDDDSEDEDPSMRSPLFLPSDPDKPAGAATLNLLEDKLASMFQHPEERTPAVLQHEPVSTSTSEDGEEEDAVPPLDLDEADTGAEVPGIKLRTKRSCNFGAPLGIMPRYRNASDFEDF